MPPRPLAWAAIVLSASLAALALGAFVLLRGSDVAQPTASPAAPAAPHPSNAGLAPSPQAIVREAAGPVIWHAWRRDGSVVYATRAPDAVCVTDGDTSRRLSTFTPTHCLPALSSGDGVAAFSLGSAIGLLDLDTGAFTRVETGGEILSLAWRLEPRELAYSVGNAIYLVASDGSDPRLLRRVMGFRSDWWERSAPSLRVDGLQWAGNGRSLGYVAWAVFDDEHGVLSPRIAVFDVKSRRVIRHVDGYSAGDDVFAISPDGRHLTWAGNFGDVDNAVRIDGDQVACAGTSGGHPHGAWSPDGRLVAWQYAWDAWVAPREFARGIQVFWGAGRGSPNRTPDGWPEFEWSPDGKAFVYHYREFKKTEQPEFATSEVRLVSVSDLVWVAVKRPLAVRSLKSRLWFQWSSLPYLVLARDFKGTDLAWSPDGKKVSWSDGKQIWSVSLPSSATP